MTQKTKDTEDQLAGYKRREKDSMDAQAIINVLNRILDLGDTLDNAGGGVQGLTNGEHTTREVCRIELGQFLLYIADGATSITDAQAALLSFVFSEGGSMIPGWQLKQLAKTSGTPDPNKNLTFTAFIQADLAVSVQEGERTTAGTDTLFTIYDTFGQLIVAFNENAISQERYDRTIAGFRARVASAGSDAGKTSDKSSKVNKANGKGKTEKAPKAKSSGKQKTASKKEKASSTSRKKAGSAADTAKRDRKTIPAKDVLLPGKYKGIHNVTGKPETVSPYGTWTMDIPAGFSYTMDPDCAARSMMGMGPAYSLQVQATEDCDFSSAYDSSFGLAIYPSSVVWVNIEDGGEDLRSSYAQNTLRDLQNDGFRSYTVLVHTPDVLVQYDNSVASAHDYNSPRNKDSISVYEQVSKIVARLDDPILLTKTNRNLFERVLRWHIVEICVEIARNDDRYLVDRLIDLGYISEDNLEGIITAVNRLQDAAMTGYLLEVKRRRFNQSAFDFDL